MNFESVMDALQALRAQLDSWGLTTGALVAIGAGALLVFLWSMRELASWFFKVQALRSEVQVLNAKIDRLLEAVNRQGASVAPLIVEVPAEPVKKAESSFRLDH